LRFDLIELPTGAFGFIACLLHQLFPLDSLSGPTAFAFFERCQSCFHGGRCKCGKEHLCDAFIQPYAAQALAGVLRRVKTVGLVTRIAWNVATCSGVRDLHLASATSTAE